MDNRRQNIVLKLFHDMTRYFPAVRAVRMLMNGKTLRPNECAVIVQSLAEALRDLVPLNLIENDKRRYLEGTRLLLGFVLQKVATLAIEPTARADEGNDKGQPYLDLFKTVDLRDVLTNEIIVDPIQTDLGLMERGTYNAFQSGGILSHPGAEDVGILSTSPDLPALRAATSNGGVAPEASYYETNTIRASLSIRDLNNHVLEELRGFSRELRYVGMLSDRSGMNVIHPTSLKSAKAPVLTLDRDGYLCVYVGRAACAPPDRDISIFRPVHGSEEAIDVNIVAQLVEPVLRLREHDGTIIFELLSESLRSENAKPTELLMFCVDCSESMDSASDFREIQENSVAPVRTEATIDDVPVAGEIDEVISLTDMRDWIADYESFDDMLGLVASAETRTRRAVAENVVDFVSLLISRELFKKGKEVSALKSSATRFMLVEIATTYEIELGSLRRLVGGLTIYKAELCDFLIVKAESWTAREAFPWSYGEPIPRREAPSPGLHHLDVTNSLSAPSEIICPISQAVFEDPVTTSDNFTYERRSIERWFQIRQSSPSTGLPLSDLTLRRNQLVHNQTVRWVAGEDILQAASQAADRFRLRRTRSVVTLQLNFVTPAGTFTRNLPSTLPLSDLYRIAYRGMRGVHRSFLLHLRGSLLVSSDQQLRRCGITTGSDIVASLQPVHGDPALPTETESGEMCLIKVYESSSESSSELFSYWIPHDTSHTMASIIFRFWRFKLSSLGVIQALDQEVWSGLKYGGDGVSYGQRHDHWDLLAEALNKTEPRKLVASERLCVSPPLEQGIDMEWQSSTSGEHNTSQANSVGTSPAAYYRVLKVSLSRYRSPEVSELQRQERLRLLTRLAVSKQVFGAFINRMIAYNYPTVIGLVSFGTSPSLSQPLTGIIENFRHAVDTLEPSGDTSLWDALALAADQLVHFGRKYPGISKRIICLSDGVDTKSARTATDVCRRLLRDKIVVDSCSIGVEDNSSLRTVSFLTGGYKFVPQTLEQAVAICELEPVLSLHERLPVVRPVMGPLTSRGFAVASLQASEDEVTQDKFPVQKPHPNINDRFFRIDSLEKEARSIVAQPVDGNPVASTVVRQRQRQRRLLTEIRNITANPHPSYDVYVSESNMGFWKIVMSGPAESAYAAGTFVLYLHMGDDYPLSPPHARFITRIFHPNINRGGRACHSIFDRNWLVDITNKQVLDTVFGLLLVPEFTDPINTVVTLNYYWDEVAFREEVKKHIEKYALKGREELGKEILGD
jgi:ubiquitin-protein ligase/Mg-chelatase subunit ChlD